MIGKIQCMVMLALMVVGTHTLMARGTAGVCYIDIDYRNHYHCPSQSALFRRIRSTVETLRLCMSDDYTAYKTWLDPLPDTVEPEVG